MITKAYNIIFSASFVKNHWINNWILLDCKQTIEIDPLHGLYYWGHVIFSWPSIGDIYNRCNPNPCHSPSAFCAGLWAVCKSHGRRECSLCSILLQRLSIACCGLRCLVLLPFLHACGFILCKKSVSFLCTWFAAGLNPNLPFSWPATAGAKLWLHWLFVELLRSCRVGDSCACLLFRTVSLLDCSSFLLR